ncbi:MAG: substrate-binding domain-containing protein, partial [Verrucomicrobia bacterium]|nr:substrate-binding domain-containing protein [Leptolyngbya sp. ES-bin-22]
MPQRTSPPKNTPLLGLAMLLALLTASQPLAALLALNPVLAQSPAPSFSPTGVVPTGTTVRVDGSSTMATLNQALKKVYEEKYAGTSVTLAEEGSDAALKALLDGTVDIAAIGRALTAKEKQQGLVAQPIARRKIAIVVGPNNPFNGNITFEQFAKMFRGELRDWSELGGAPGPIRFVDRPSSSDTRQAFRPYPVFQKAPFKAGENTKQTAKDSTDEVVQALGTDGIGYAIADQVLDRQDVRIISMHKTLPDDPRYPFSQPLAYVYKGTPSSAVLSFLGVATAATSQSIIEAARETATTAVDASPSPVSSSVSPSPAVSATATP